MDRPKPKQLKGKEREQFQQEMKALIDRTFQYDKEHPEEQRAWFLEAGDLVLSDGPPGD